MLEIDDSIFDDKGNLPRGESGQILPPVTPDPATAAPATEDQTVATQPSPAPVTTPASTEDKSGAAPKEPAPGAPAAKAPAPADEAITAEEEAALKTRLSRPTDKGDEWRIRAYREGEKLKKQLTPVNDVIERIGSPDRARRGLELTADLADPDVPIANAVEKMTALSSSRFQELHNHLYTETMTLYPDTVASDLVDEKATVAELKEGLALLRGGKSASAPPQPGTTTTPATLQKPTEMSDQDWEDFKIDYPEAYRAMQAQAAATAAPPPSKEEAPNPVAEELKNLKDEKQQEWVNQQVAEISAKGEEMHAAAYKVVDDGLRDLGLMPDPAKDDEKTIKLKTRTASRIRELTEKEFDGPDGPEGPTDYSLLSAEQKTNRKLAETVIGLLAKKDYAAAADYQDRLNAQVDLAFQRVADTEIDIYNAAMLQSTAPKQRGGTSAHTRPELVGGSAVNSGSINKTPWLEPGYRQPGESAQDAMMRYLDEHDQVPGR